MTMRERVRALRLSKNMLQQDVAVRAGIKQQDLSKYEVGQSDMTVERLRRVLAAMGCDLEIVKKKIK